MKTIALLALLTAACDDVPPKSPPLPAESRECFYWDRFAAKHLCTCPSLDTDAGTSADAGPTHEGDPP